jgi:hypothetical protein
MKKLILPVLFGAVIWLVYMTLSWTVFPFHTASIKTIPEGHEVLAQLEGKSLKSGLYTYPGPTDMDTPEKAAQFTENEMPVIAFMVYNESNAYFKNMAPSFIRYFIFLFFATGIVAWLMTLALPNLNTFWKKSPFCYVDRNGMCLYGSVNRLQLVALPIGSCYGSRI